MDKITQRKLALAARASLTPQQKENADKTIYDKVKALASPYQVIGIYYNKSDEVETTKLIASFLNEKKKVLLPKVSGNTLTFHEIKSLNDVVLGNFDVYEPTTPVSDINDIDLMIVPLVAYDKNYNRIGYGKGYYDSVLNQVKGLKVGIAYSVQEVGVIETRDEDIKLDDVITEKK